MAEYIAHAGEPELKEVFNDCIIRLVMERDGVDPNSLRRYFGSNDNYQHEGLSDSD